MEFIKKNIELKLNGAPSHYYEDQNCSYKQISVSLIIVISLLLWDGFKQRQLGLLQEVVLFVQRL